jgi:hypothetical protein
MTIVYALLIWSILATLGCACLFVYVLSSISNQIKINDAAAEAIDLVERGYLDARTELDAINRDYRNLRTALDIMIREHAALVRHVSELDHPARTVRRLDPDATAVHTIWRAPN